MLRELELSSSLPLFEHNVHITLWFGIAACPPVSQCLSLPLSMLMIAIMFVVLVSADMGWSVFLLSVPCSSTNIAKSC